MSPNPHPEPPQPEWGAPRLPPGPPAGYQPYGYMPQPAAVVAAKTPGVAVLLSLLWMGAGHLYAGRTGPGVGFMATNFFLWLLWFIPLIGWVLAPLLWLPLVVVAAYTAASAAQEHNARWGIARL